MNECVLVVDDDAEIVKAIAILLEKEGGHLCVLIHNNISYLFSIIWKKQGAPRGNAPRRSLLCRLPAMVTVVSAAAVAAAAAVTARVAVPAAAAEQNDDQDDPQAATAAKTTAIVAPHHEVPPGLKWKPGAGGGWLPLSGPVSFHTMPGRRRGAGKGLLFYLQFKCAGVQL